MRKGHVFFDGTISVPEQRELVAECVAEHLLKRGGVCVDDDSIECVTRIIANERATPLLVVVGL